MNDGLAVNDREIVDFVFSLSLFAARFQQETKKRRTENWWFLFCFSFDTFNTIINWSITQWRKIEESMLVRFVPI